MADGEVMSGGDGTEGGEGSSLCVEGCLDESWGGPNAVQFKLMGREFMVTLKE